MIRVGSVTSGVSTTFNDFHSKTPLLTEGFYCNITGGEDPPPPPANLFIPRMAFEQSVPPIPSSLANKNFFIWRNPFGVTEDLYPLPQSISSTYLAITRVSGGYQVAKFSAYSGNAVLELPSTFELSLGHGLQTNDVTYLRVGDVLPTPTSFTWLSSSSGTVPRLIVGYQTSIIRNGQNFSPSCDGTNLYRFALTFDSVDLKLRNAVTGSFNVIPTLNTWSGSSLGGSTFEILIIMESCEDS